MWTLFDRLLIGLFSLGAFIGCIFMGSNLLDGAYSKEEEPIVGTFIAVGLLITYYIFTRVDEEWIKSIKKPKK